MTNATLRIFSGLTLGVLSTASPASIVSFVSNEASLVGSSGVSFEGAVQWTPGSGSSGVLELTITNTTGGSVGGYLTGLAFNLGGHSASVALVSAGGLDFVGIADVNAEPFGHAFAAGAALGGNWQGGGRPQGGLASGQTGVFTFAVTGENVDLLESASIFEGPYDYDFVARFRGLADGGSSKVAGAITGVPEIPAPGSAALMAAGLGIAARRRRPALV